MKNDLKINSIQTRLWKWETNFKLENMKHETNTIRFECISTFHPPPKILNPANNYIHLNPLLHHITMSIKDLILGGQLLGDILCLFLDRKI